jgi:hypothetical protein
MVWSDQSSFPFYVIDNNGNIILTIDNAGLHLVGPNGRIDAIIDPLQYPTIQWSNPSGLGNAKIVFIPGTNPGSYRLALQGNLYTSTKPGNPVMKGNILIDEGRVWMYNNTYPGQITQGGAVGVGDQDLFLTAYDSTTQSRSVISLFDNSYIDIYTKDAAGNLMTQLVVDDTRIVINTPGKSPHVFDNSTGFWSVLGRDWTAIPTFNGWVPVGGTYATPAMKWSTDGRVYFKGTIRSGATVDGTQVFNVPSIPSWAPAGGLEVKLRPTTEGGGAADGRIIVNGIGQGFLFGAGGTTQLGLDGLSFALV